MSDREQIKKEIEEAVKKIEERLQVAKQALLDIDQHEDDMNASLVEGSLNLAGDSKGDLEEAFKTALSAFEDITISADSCFEEFLPQLEKDIVQEFETANY